MFKRFKNKSLPVNYIDSEISRIMAVPMPAFFLIPHQSKPLLTTSLTLQN